MKKIFYAGLLLACWQGAIAQTATPFVINCAGATGTVNNIYFDFNLGETAVTTIGSNTMITQGLLQPGLVGSVLPVTGLEFQAKRIDNNKIQLNWHTVQETNNKGFYVERKKENESNYMQLYFVPSLAQEGNSASPLQYQAADNNNYSGKTYYRLKQEDIDGKFVYSQVRMVNGYNGKTLSLKAWPMPSNGNLTVLAEGIDKDVLQVTDLNGRLLQQVNISNGNMQQITGLRAGIYFLRLAGEKELVQKIIVQ